MPWALLEEGNKTPFDLNIFFASQPIRTDIKAIPSSMPVVSSIRFAAQKGEPVKPSVQSNQKKIWLYQL